MVAKRPARGKSQLLSSLAGLLFAVAPGPAAAEEPGPRPPEAITAYAARQMEALGVPGCALALVQGDRVLQVTGIGVADGRGRAVTATTPFLIGSLTKAFTAIAVLQLAEAGRVDLDQPVRRYVPRFTLRDPAASEAITVRHLLNQTSGIPQRAGLENVYDDRSAEQLVAQLADVTPLDAPGKKYVYSNANYWVLEALIAAVSGMSYADALEAHVFSRLQMKNSVADGDEAAKSLLAEGHRSWFGVAVPDDMPNVSGHVIAASGQDMAQLLIAALNQGKVSGAAVLSEASVRAMLTPPEGFRYGMGWQTETAFDETIRRHSGAAANYRAEMAVVPERGVGFALLCNTYHHLMNDDFRRVASNITGMLLGHDPPADDRAQFPGQARKYALFAAIPFVFSLAGVLKLRRFRAALRREEGAPRKQLRRAVLWLVVNTGVMAGVLYAIPVVTKTPLDVLVSFVPDMALLLGLGLVIPVVTASLRVAFAAQALRRRAGT